MKHLPRIITFVGYQNDGLSNPHTILAQGSRTVTLPPKQRLFAVRRVAYDDSMTPLYAEQYPNEQRFTDLQELIKQQRLSQMIQDAPILDNDHSLKVYEKTD